MTKTKILQIKVYSLFATLIVAIASFAYVGLSKADGENKIKDLVLLGQTVNELNRDVLLGVIQSQDNRLGSFISSGSDFTDVRIANDLAFRDSDGTDSGILPQTASISGKWNDNTSSTFFSFRNTSVYPKLLCPSDIQLRLFASSTVAQMSTGKIVVVTSSVSALPFDASAATIGQKLLSFATATGTVSPKGYASSASSTGLYSISGGLGDCVRFNPGEYLLGFRQHDSLGISTTSSDYSGFADSSYYVITPREQ